MPNLVGLSVSFCVQEICEGKVAIEDVAYIIPGFNVKQTPEQIWKNYTERFHYWKEYPERALEVIKALKIRYDLYGRSSIRNRVWSTVEEIEEIV